MTAGCLPFNGQEEAARNYSPETETALSKLSSVCVCPMVFCFAYVEEEKKSLWNSYLLFSFFLSSSFP